MAQPRTTSPATGVAGEGEGHESVPGGGSPLPCTARRTPLNSMVALQGGGPETGASCRPAGTSSSQLKERGRRGRGGTGRERQSVLLELPNFAKRLPELSGKLKVPEWRERLILLQQRV